MRGGQHLELMVVEVMTCVHDLGSWYEHIIDIGPENVPESGRIRLPESHSNSAECQ
jgi:hypothetical protein